MKFSKIVKFKSFFNLLLFSHKMDANLREFLCLIIMNMWAKSKHQSEAKDGGSLQQIRPVNKSKWARPHAKTGLAQKVRRGIP